MDKKNRVILVNTIKEILEKEQEVLFAYLYGSSAYDHDQPGSDIDIAVYLQPSNVKNYIKKEDALTTALAIQLHNDQIDLRILNTLPSLLQYNVLKEGIPIFVRNESERVEFETRVMYRFFELKPYIDEFKQMLSLRVKSGI
jgi:predicted nucleotidyltransferase